MIRSTVEWERIGGRLTFETFPDRPRFMMYRTFARFSSRERRNSRVGKGHGSFIWEKI